MKGNRNNVDHSEILTVLSLCTGYGGLEIGLSQALQNPLRVIAVEIEAYAVANLVAKAEAGKLAVEAVYTDVKTFPAKRFRGCFDILTAGYPCQPFSIAGKRQGADDPRYLWPYVAEIIEEIRPVWVWLENVAGHITLGFPQVYRNLRQMGYVVEAGLFTAVEAGCPFEGERLFVLATSNYEGFQNCMRIRNEEEFSSTAGLRRKPWLVAGQGFFSYEWERPREIESGMGGATDGSDHWVDRLRLLGSGVVPAQAGIAFRTLYEKHFQ